jgi:hypothetical protein
MVMASSLGGDRFWGCCYLEVSDGWPPLFAFSVDIPSSVGDSAERFVVRALVVRGLSIASDCSNSKSETMKLVNWGS